MRVAETRSHVETELIIIVHVSIGNFDQLVTALNNDLLFKNGIEKWVNFVFDLLDKDGVALHERELKSILE